VSGQWTNRYPKIANVSHHVYLEGYNLPTLNQGATDPAISPDGKTLAIAARGWIWLMNTTTREARRLTKSGAVDSRPAWSPDGRQIAFVRDDMNDTSIVLIDAASGREKVLVDSPALDLDPVFARDGRAVFYSSAEAGDLDLWRIEIATGAKKRLTSDRGQELAPQPAPDDAQLLYVSKVGSIDSVAIVNLSDNSKRILHSEGIASQMRSALSPDGRSFAINLPVQDRWQLWLMDTKGSPAIQIARTAEYPLMPAWSPDNSFIYFAEPDADESFHLYRIAPTGGTPEDISPLSWNWGEPTARFIVKTRMRGSDANLPARLTVVDGKGHPVLPSTGQARFDGQNGAVFFYSPGTIELEVPAGNVRVMATHGFGAVAQTATRKIPDGKMETIEIEMPAPLWNPASEGWYSADLHSHLNYGGPYLLTPEDIILDMRGEALDLSTPQLANLHTRFIDTEWWNWRRSQLPMIVFAQEVRSHFLGHVGVVGADSLFHPWYSGPGYPVYDRLDLPNSIALQFARQHGGINSYVHPVSTKDPFPSIGEPNGLPLELVPDAVLGDVDTLEVTCLWSDELGTSEAWYRLLNLGIPIAPSAGSDTMHNFYRTMAIGATRIYAKPDGAMNLPNYLEAVRRGRSFVSNGPLLKFNIGGAEMGGVISASSNQQIEWKLEAVSSAPVEKVEILVNGKVAWRSDGLSQAGRKTYTGKVKVPSGGWIVARIYGGVTRPPMADSYPYAHTAPIWFGRIGSFDAAAAKASAQDLLRWMNVAEKRVEQGYSDARVDNLKKRFAEARRILETRAK
ncbi:MAG: CehA/McbA family metallohydrolase, partial [Acidobacteria bacterium]|nr:CehA/McbA family metallohydrolase [Acidobacteriota bacterium]